MGKYHLLGAAIASAFLLASISASAATTDKCRARQAVPASKLLQEPAPGAGVRGSGSASPCARPPMAAVLPQEALPPPAAPQPVPRRGFFGLPLLALLGGVGAAGLVAATGGDGPVSP